MSVEAAFTWQSQPMVQYAFAIDNRVCIGCHACTVACKAEHFVPIGVNRTWVKYVEHGEYPNVSRAFQVTRCNHCRDAPCVTICPTTALFKRDDGIVDFDNRRCIGCKSCTQACPYDAIYIDPGSGTAAKCNFCAHRIDQGLNPSCVNVCPEQAIRFGDISDATSDISRLIAREPVTVRKPEKNTLPSVYYIGGDEAALDPAATAVPEQSIWSQQSRGVGHNAGVPGSEVDLLGIVRRAKVTHEQRAGANEASEGERALLNGLLVELEKATGSAKVRRAYDQPDKGVMWGWEVAAYILTKAIAAGLMFVASLSFIFAQLGFGPVFGTGGAHALAGGQVLPAILALVFLGLTGGLLVKDLDRPDRFLYVLLRPQWKSWLVRGAYLITAFGALATVWLVVALMGGGSGLFKILAWPMALLALAVAGYTALLFGQCKGRDFWQSPALLVHMLLHAPLAGFAAMALLGKPAPLGLMLCIVANAAVILSEVFGKHPSKDSHETAHAMRRGRAGKLLYFGVFGAGHAIPLVLAGLAAGGPLAASLGKEMMALAALLVLGGMMLTEYLWVYLPQRRPNA